VVDRKSRFFGGYINPCRFSIPPDHVKVKKKFKTSFISVYIEFTTKKYCIIRIRNDDSSEKSIYKKIQKRKQKFRSRTKKQT